jgi:LytS/YehU family sensor histidine kinase
MSASTRTMEPTAMAPRWPQALFGPAQRLAWGALPLLLGGWFLSGTDLADGWSRLVATALLANGTLHAWSMLRDARTPRRPASAPTQARTASLEGSLHLAQMVALQSRLQPHFACNALGAIAELIHDDPRRAEETALRLAKLMRHVLHNADTDRVRLADEFAIAQAYLEIERVRLGEHLRFLIDLPAELCDLPVPGMLVQPLVENAVRHGVSQRRDAGLVRLHARRDGAYCHIEVTDDGPGVSRVRGSGQARHLLRQRLQGLYGHDHEFSLERDQRRGHTIALVRVPCAAVGAY